MRVLLISLLLVGHASAACQIGGCAVPMTPLARVVVESSAERLPPADPRGQQRILCLHLCKSGGTNACLPECRDVLKRMEP